MQYFGDGPDNLLQQASVWLGDAVDDETAIAYAVRTSGLGRSGEVRLGLAGVGDRDAASALRGRLVIGDASQLAPLDAGEFYWHELVGCAVEARDGRAFGTVSRR